jgi:hypothetical protein
MNKTYNMLSFLVALMLFSTLFSGCTDKENENGPPALSSFDSVKAQFHVSASFEKNLTNGSIDSREGINWGHQFFSYSKSAINGSIHHDWNENVYSATWNYYYLNNLTKKEGNMTIIFDENGSSIIELKIFETSTDEEGKTTIFEVKAEDIPKNQNVSTQEYKTYTIQKNNTCSHITDINYTEIVPTYHQTLNPGTESLIDFQCDNSSSFIVTIFKYE